MNFFYLAPIHYSIIENNLELFKILFNSKTAKPFAKDNHGLTIWHYAAKYGRLEIIQEICSKTHEFINDVDYKNQSSLFIAAKNAYVDVFNALLEIKGINVNIKDKTGI